MAWRCPLLSLRLPAMNQTSLHLPDTVQSVVYSQRNGPLIAAAAVLWIADDDLVLDVTYGRGLFWADYRPSNLVAHDLVTDGVDCRHLPEDDATFDVVVFDPPYIVQGGRDTSKTAGFLDRYGLVDSPKTLLAMQALIRDGMTEARRVLKPEGRMFVKCMDYINGGKFIQGRHFVVSTALDLDLEQVDEFVHYSGAGPGAWDVQLHSRHVHSFLCVFEK